jgi:tricorn protease
MIKRSILTLAVALCLTGGASVGLAQNDSPFARFPSVSPDGQTIAFSFQGDIWAMPVGGGRAARLTIHEAYESYPRWSPDGREIAFVSDRYGSDDVYIMSADGGNVRRLTYHSTRDVTGSWTPDGNLLFETGARK